jgi:phospholipid/cholesterol/gamma-HCH transport system permease protein
MNARDAFSNGGSGAWDEFVHGRDNPEDERAESGFAFRAGDMAIFAWRSFGQVRRLRSFGGEALRQAGLIATGSVLVICVIAFLAGGSCGLESSSLARAFGARPIAAGFSSWCTLR